MVLRDTRRCRLSGRGCLPLVAEFIRPTPRVTTAQAGGTQDFTVTAFDKFEKPVPFPSKHELAFSIAEHVGQINRIAGTFKADINERVIPMTRISALTSRG
ncbi:uncharacterized protein METZ01_LOCUS477074 [marine metagenome]|uniref:Uncharacterized protein n=1 Tax=marine metagenome TaxID=408172 RepID=A0A383BWM0_9ZZZZ